ncbi:TIGR03089 family protein [Streptoalloteichus tenebrarius]|uniref:TIGR03089 family protein n=1 Tax=Streptoalloteichus tenebrarius (strain ATCC 17920 / DSM 40477 / JCM 4838 / CBS 697.72 / NBRC 16177 / NCIMB 11028 / NRRL B-12390 / A12253. 1 / ISP 5477) TaxID=1933 RepID=A0ABT1HSY1_STRSD|nr:TIGR03089 family protein [Streptoalloteichus tenebrarius]MCP2258644.1 TIGR03089 family protein [Streptoalloteichus tenebrarius]BFF02789.1 TIGR03089 family protein [Streptoalloteichus tenebrarius]
MSITDRLLGRLLALDPGRPLITHYDDASGARVELSRATIANWAAKTANWLVDELDVEQGSPVAVALPAHWQTVGVLLGAWWCGAEVTDDPSGAAVAFVRPDAGSVAAAGAADLVAAVALDPMGRGLAEPPAGSVDYVSSARVHGDTFRPPLPVDGDTPALLGSTVDEVMASAAARAAEFGLGAEDRVLSTVDWNLPGGVLDGLLAVLAGSASLVQVSNPDPGALPARATSERVTATLGVELPGVRRLPAPARG